MNHRFGDANRPYAKSHPWITFTFDARRLACADWVRIGEALAKSDHIANVPLPPAISQELHQLYLIKGALGSAQIEGNTLSEDQARAQLDGQLHLPESQEYLARDFDNIRNACELVAREVHAGAELRLTTARIRQFNKMVLDGLPRDPDVIPGKIRTKGVGVGSVYLGAPAGDCEYLLDQLCEWLDQIVHDAEAESPELRRSFGVIRAVLAHLYLAWIHPFGDGNGRTARLIEFQLLLAAGFPTPACHLLSNYYNKTRALYYQALRETSQAEGYPAWRFASYAIQGFVEELRETLDKIQSHQCGLAWLQLVGETHLGRAEPTINRRMQLLLALRPGGPTEFTPIASLDRLNPELAALYATKTAKTLTRDINVLLQSGLVVPSDDGDAIRPHFEQLFAFLPIRKRPTPATEREMLESLASASTANPVVQGSDSEPLGQ